MQVRSPRSFEIPITPRVHVYDPNQGLICKCIRRAVGRDSRHTPVQVCDPIHDTVCNPVCRAVVRDPNTLQTKCVTPILTQYATGLARRSLRSPNTPRSKSVNRDRAGALFSDVSRCFGGSPATPPQPPPPHRVTPVGVGVLLDPVGPGAPSKLGISLCWATDQHSEKTTAGHSGTPVSKPPGNLLLA